MTASTISLNNITLLQSDAVPAVRLDIVVPAGMGEQDCLLQALFTNRLLREGTIRLTASALAERLDWLGAWLELTVSVHHSFVTLYTLRRHAPEAFRLVHDMLCNPTFPVDRLEAVRAANRSQYLVNRYRGDVVARRLLGTAIYGPDHPCGRFAEEKDFDAINRDDLLRFHQRHYASYHLFLAGDVDDALLRLTEELFGGEDSTLSSPAGERSPLPSREAVGLRLNHTLPTAVQASIRMGGLMMDVGSDDYYTMRVVTAILGGYFGSRLMKNVREKQGLTYSINADLFTNTRQVLFVVNSEAAADKGSAVVDEVVRQCESLCEKAVDDDELTLVRNYMLGEIYRNYESVFSLIDAPIHTHTLGLPTTHLNRTVEAIRTATPADLLAVARRWLRPDLFTTVVVAP